MNQGFVRFIVILIIFIIVLSLAGFSFRGIFQNQFVRENFRFIYDAGKFIWKEILEKPTMFIVNLVGTYVIDPLRD